MNKLKVIQLDKQLPSIDVPSPFEKAIDPTKLDEQLATTGKQQLRHANEQLVLTRHYPGRYDKWPTRQ
jgi:hypothetical protein